MSDAFSPEEQQRGFSVIRERYEEGEPGAFIPYATALRFGRGTTRIPSGARTLLEDAVAHDNARALVMLAEMLAEGEGGPADGKRAIALLTSPLAEQAAYSARPVLAGLYLDNRYTGRRPREALRLLAGSGDIDARIRAAGLFMDYDEKLEYPQSYIATMDAATKVGEPGAAWAWARLKLSGHPQFGNKDDEARAILATLAAEGDPEAPIMIAETQYVDLDAARFNPPRRDGGMTDPNIRTVIEGAMKNGQASAFRVMAKFQRVGVVYPQDDAGATKSLIEAAERGESKPWCFWARPMATASARQRTPQRLRWWREAARLGSLEATEWLVNVFPFDSFDKQMTLREGITQRLGSTTMGLSPMRCSATWRPRPSWEPSWVAAPWTQDIRRLPKRRWMATARPRRSRREEAGPARACPPRGNEDRDRVGASTRGVLRRRARGIFRARGPRRARCLGRGARTAT